MGDRSEGEREWAAQNAVSLAALACSTIFVIMVVAAALLYRSRGPAVDFASFWAAGRLAAGGHASLAYDLQAHRTVELTAAHMGGSMPFAYPPPFLFAVLPIGFTPFWLGYVCWVAATAALYFAATRAFVAARYAFAHPAALLNAMIGQNGLLTSAVFISGVRLLESRPFLAGTILGLLVIKPQLALLLPLATIAARQWRAIAGAILSSGAMLALAALAFGAGTYGAFLATSSDYIGYMAAGRWNLAEIASVFSFFRFLGVGQAAALALQLVSAILAAALTWRAWADGHENRSALLAASTLLVSPYLFTYDSLLLILPLATFLDRKEWAKLAIAWTLLLLPLAGGFGLYAGPNMVPLAAGLCVWWLWAEPKKKAAAPSGTAASIEFTSGR